MNEKIAFFFVENSFDKFETKQQRRIKQKAAAAEAMRQ